MPSRQECKEKYTRWSFFFTKDPSASKAKDVFLEVVESRKPASKPILHEISASRIDCVWHRAVTYDSAARLIALAKARHDSFEIIGVPKPVTGGLDISECETTSVGNRTDSQGARGKEEEVAEPHKKRSCIDTPGGAPRHKQTKTLLAADTSQGAARAASASALASPLAVASGLAGHQHLRLLSMKVLIVVERRQKMVSLSPGERRDDSHKYNVELLSGRDSNANVFVGVSQGAVQQPVAIKIMRGDVFKEVAVCSALLPHPHIVTLLDAGLFKFRGMQDAAVGLVFEAFDADLRTFLKTNGP